MAIFTVTIELKSFYEDEKFNLTNTRDVEIECEDLDTLYDLLVDDYVMGTDDSSVINYDAEDNHLIDTNVEYVVIRDENGKELYRDEDYKEDK